MNGAVSVHYFREKGERDEAVIHNLAPKTFLTDWCYPSPKKPNGKELCDLLVVFDDVGLFSGGHMRSPVSIRDVRRMQCDQKPMKRRALWNGRRTLADTPYYDVELLTCLYCQGKIDRKQARKAGGGSLRDGTKVTPSTDMTSIVTSARDIYICSASTPPGGGVHGMCGYHAAKTALSRLRGMR